jgi:hypothetical protein
VLRIRREGGLRRPLVGFDRQLTRLRIDLAQILVMPLVGLLVVMLAPF